MRKIFAIPAILLLLGGADALAQGRLTDKDSRLLDECRTLFTQGDYAAAGTLLELWYETSAPGSVNRMEEADYMRTVIEAETYPAQSMDCIWEFMQKYPNSVYYNRMLMLLGSSYYARHDYKEAIVCFDQCEPLLLDDNDCCRMVRYNTISLIRCGKTDEGLLQMSILEQLVQDPEEDEDIVFYKAYLDYLKGKNDKAKAGFENSLEGSHANEAKLYLADMNLRESADNEEAYRTASRMVMESDDPILEAEAERILGEYWYRNGDYRQAEDLLTSYLLLKEGKKERHDIYLLGMSCFMNGDMDGALANLSEVSEGEDMMAQNAALHVGLAALSKGDKNMARMAFERASEIPGDPEVREQALYNYAMILHETAFSPFAESVTSFERFLNEFPKSRYADRVSSYLVDVYLNTNSYDAALASIAKIKSPGASIQAAKMQLLYNKAMEKLASGDLDEVTILLTEVITLDRYGHDMAVEATFWRGEAYYRTGQSSMAETDYKRYLALIDGKPTPSSALANYGLGYIYYGRQKYDQAWKYFRQVYTDAGKTGVNAEILSNACLRAGDCMFIERQYDQAKEYYNMAMNVDRNNGDYALYQTALVNGLQRRYDQKIKDLDKLVSDYPESPYLPSALYEEGRAYQQTDRPNEAIVVFKRIVRDYPSSDLARRASAETALIYYQTDQYDNAIVAYKDVIARYPGSDEARTALVDLKSIYVETGDINTFVEYTKTVQGAAPIEVNERDSLTYAAAESMFGRDDKEQALVRFRQYLEQFPDGAFAANAWYYQGLLLEERNDSKGAFDSFIHAAGYENSRFCEGSLDHAASLAWKASDWKQALDLYIRLYDKTADADRQKRSLYSIVSSAGRTDNTDAVLKYADKALQTQLSADQKTEVCYWKAKSLLRKGDRTQVKPLLEELSKDTRSVYGAESDYLLGQLLFDSGDKEGAEKVVMELIQEGTPHTYWLARSFILLSDIYKSQGKDVEARQYLLSLKSNYTENDDISDMITARLE